MSYLVTAGAVVLTSANNTLRVTEGATTATTTIPAGTYYLRGGYATNLIVQSENLSAWSAGGVSTSARTEISPRKTTAYTIENTTGAAFANILLNIIFTGNGTKVVSLFVKQSHDFPALFTDINIYDFTANVSRQTVRIAWSGSNVSSVVSLFSVGNIFNTIDIGNGWWFVSFTAPSIVATNSNSILIYPSGAQTGLAGKIFAWGVQVENATVPGLYVPTTGSSLTGPSDELTLALKTALEAATASANTYDITVARNIDPASAHTRVTITRIAGSDNFGVLWGNASTTTDERLLGYLGDDIVAASPKVSAVAAAGNWVCNDIPRELEPVSERIVSVPRAASGRVQGVSRSARMLSWRLGLAFVDERRMLVERALSYAGDTLEGFLERFGANAAIEVWEVPIDTGTTLVPLSLARLVDVVHFSEDALSSFDPVRLGPGVPLYSLDMRLHAKV